MSSPGLPTLELDVRSRRAEPCAARLALLLAAGAPLFIGQDWEHLALAVMATVACAIGFRRAGWLGGAHRIERVVWLAEGRWRLTDAAGQECDAVLGPSSRVAAGMMWLSWTRHPAAAEGGTRSMWLTSRDVPQQQLRRLGVQLRLAGYNSRADAIGQRRTFIP